MIKCLLVGAVLVFTTSAAQAQNVVGSERQHFGIPNNVMATFGDDVRVRAPYGRLQKVDPWAAWLPGVVLVSPPRGAGLLNVPPRVQERAQKP